MALFFLNAPLAVEYDFLKEANNQVLFVSVNRENQKKYLLKRENLPQASLDKKIKGAGTNQAKLQAIRDVIARDKFGRLITYRNNFPLTAYRVAKLGKEVLTFSEF